MTGKLIGPMIPRLDAVRRWFEESFVLRGEAGAAVSIWRDGEEILHLAGGTTRRDGGGDWTAGTLAPVWSATKGLAAVATVAALREERVDLDSPVARLWPGFAGAGKAAITLRQVLSHTAGLPALDAPVPPVTDHAAVVAALERQSPLAPAGSVQAYHPRTFGFLLDEIIRRATGVSSLGVWFEERVRRAAGAEFWIGLPESEHGRVATLIPGRPKPEHQRDPFMAAFQTPDSLTRRAFASPAGLHAVADFNQPAAWTPGYAAMGGVGSARGLGCLYAALASEGAGIFPAEVCRELSRPVSFSEDAVLHRPLCFGSGVMMNPRDGSAGLMGPSMRAFGHPGAGGSLAFADPENRVAFAYVMNQMELGVLPGPKALGLVRALYGDGT
jgi:CubicO group peptidase (beta-lactamase class C family)